MSCSAGCEVYRDAGCIPGAPVSSCSTVHALRHSMMAPSTAEEVYKVPQRPLPHTAATLMRGSWRMNDDGQRAPLLGLSTLRKTHGGCVAHLEDLACLGCHHPPAAPDHSGGRSVRSGRNGTPLAHPSCNSAWHFYGLPQGSTVSDYSLPAH